MVISVRTKDDILEIRALRKRPVESIAIFFDEIQIASSLSLTDVGEFSLYASEEDMQKAILVKPDLLEAGFKPLTYEKKVEPGFVDVYGEDDDGNLVVVEIKRKTAGKEAAFQLAKYIEAIRARSNRKVRGILAAPNLGKGVQRILVTLGLDYKHLDPRRCSETLSRTTTKKLGDFFEET